ncbi:MAG: hypothetical protein DLM60_03475 [Pseudonocardiales bacterium]|nr:MAG: hypothetical protein DLM60_03475 [Pseudonocardiales bacterium]
MQPVHPGWCDPRYCRFTDIDIQHRSTPTLLSTCEHKWWFTLARADEWAHPEAHGDTELLIDVHNTMLRDLDVQHVLRAQEIGLYARRLLTEHHRAHLLGASVLGDAVPASAARRQSRGSPAGRDTRAKW